MSALRHWFDWYSLSGLRLLFITLDRSPSTSADLLVTFILTVMMSYDLNPRMNGLVLRKRAQLHAECSFSPAATEPNPQAGRPRQEPGALHRHLPMDGTWVPIETGATVTLSKFTV